ncbi:multicopper oxidase family protein [Cryobacterium melibiosiphilum]|uniref:Multicopper oxidase family protein n=1 Tax=Cryobacterium melibiosiphilum TaxID=995039 RepID=A0A3A5MDT1_9MICO|nr:multicopper oxidase family protein [Cryobacterium melibiosiphilum]RJT84757.1 multicopper oxidase family protein [Cryobacterium melibiosiphilum]
MTSSLISTTLSRRGFIAVGTGGLAALALASCSPTPPRYVTPTGAPVREAELARAGTGRVTSVALRAAETQLDLAGTTAETWSFGPVPASTIRMTAGDTLRATVSNDLPADTSVHWHGLALRNDMDGVPGATQAPIGAGETFTYEFVTAQPGTYWFHPHVGPQLDRGLYGALIIEDPNEPLSYDDEWVVILDDWLDGVTATPDEVLEELKGGMGGMMSGGGMGGNMMMGARSDLLGGDAGDVRYPHFLINGRPPTDPETFASAPGRRVRIRLINAGSDTAFRVALGGHRLTVTHSDGYPVNPVDTDAVLIGMGERYDVLVTLGDGAFPLVAMAEGKDDNALAIVRTGSGEAPTAASAVSALTGAILTAGALAASSEVTLSTRAVDRELSATLSGSMMAYDWAINGRRFDAANPMAGALGVSQGERVRLNITNETQMWHPFHLHGHTYQHSGAGPRKDTSIVLPGKSLSVIFDADNPGLWAAHCHNIYHAESGMMTILGYKTS